MSRITLITYFDKKELNKINEYLKNIDFEMCKVPYGINDDKRYNIDNLPYHFTVFATDKENETELLNIANNINIDNIVLKVNDIKVMDAKYDSFVLYFGIEENDELKNLQRIFYAKILEEKYNPDFFTFHLTLHIDKDKQLIYNLYNKIKQNFKPFDLQFNKLALFDYPGDMIKEI